MEEKGKNISPVMHLQDLTIQDLVAYEKASRVVCQKYENGLRQYDGSITQDSNEYRRFEKINNIHISIISEMENRVTGIR